jgi:hypothetical protein
MANGTTSGLGTPHIGRSFAGHPLEDDCPCPQEPCGLIALDRADNDCPQHGFQKAKTMRQSHVAEQCPGPGATI